MSKLYACVLMAVPVFAQGFSGGVHLNGALAAGSLRSDDMGGTHKAIAAGIGGGHLAYALDKTDELALVLNAVGWKGDAVSPLPGLTLTNDYTFLQFGLDWRHGLGGVPDTGLVGGAYLTRMKRNLSTTYADPLGKLVSTSEFTQSGRPGIKLGGFYRPTRWFSLEGSINHVFLEKRAGTPDRINAATWFQISAIFHFGGRSG